LNLQVQSQASPRGFVVDEGSLGHIFYRYLGFPLLGSSMNVPQSYFIDLLLTFATDSIVKQQSRTMHL
jgi:hypothetical protein